MPLLNVNIDHVATLRQARQGHEPDPVFAASLAETGGANGIVVHLREDRRHAQDKDLKILRNTVKTKLNMEMAATDEMVNIANEINPDMVTIVPENRLEITTEGGLNVADNFDTLSVHIKKLKKSGQFVSLFIDPDELQIDSSKKLGADMVEIHTGKYADAGSEQEMFDELKKIENAVATSLSKGLRVAAGHGLNYINVKQIARIDGIEELNIGHSIISRAVFHGIEQAVRDMVYLCEG